MGNDKSDKRPYDFMPQPSRSHSELEDAHGFPNLPAPSAPLGSTLLGRVKWKATAKMIAAYRQTIDECTLTFQSLGNLDVAKLDRERMKRMLLAAEDIHAHDGRQRRVEFLRSEEELEDAEWAAEKRRMQREQEQAQVRGAHEAWKRGETGAVPRASGSASNQVTQEAMQDLAHFVLGPDEIRLETEGKITRLLGGRGEHECSERERGLIAKMRADTERFIKENGGE